MGRYEQPFTGPDREPRPVAYSERGNCEFAHDLSVEIDETFAAYQNRPTSDNRSAQVHLGPSEVGTACDRRLAMAILGRPKVNPGGDGYAAWLGTQGHRGMAEIYEYADAGSGRFAVETPLSFPSEIVPRGTGDLLHRVRKCFVDWKFMGEWSLNKLREVGPSDTYRVQLHLYAYGAKQRGEKVDYVAIVGMPRQGKSLQEKYVWAEPYDRAIAVKALDRAARIAKKLKGLPESGVNEEWVAEELAKFPVAKDCTWCPYHLSGSKGLEHGCNGR